MNLCPFTPFQPFQTPFQCKPKASLRIQESESQVPCRSYQRCQKPPPACSRGVYRCTWELRRLRVMVTHVWVSVASEGCFSPFPLSAFCPLPTQQRVANGFPCAGALSALYSSSANSALKNRVVFRLRSVGNTWVYNMGCINSLVVPTVTSSLLGKTLVSIVSIYSWTDGKPECQTFFAQIFQSHVVQKMVYCAKQWKKKMLH